MPVSTWVEVDLDRFSANLSAIRALGGPDREAFLVVKADAYGHGAVEIAQAAQQEGVAALGVATLHEGIQLRHAGCALPIVVLSPLLVGEMEEAVLHQSIPPCRTWKSPARSRHRPPPRAVPRDATWRSTPAWAAPGAGE
jgi:alanine racemase